MLKFRDKTKELKKKIRQGRLKLVLISTFSGVVRNATLSNLVPYSYIEFKKNPHRYKDIYRVASEEDRKEIVSIERKIDRLYNKLAKLKQEAFKRGEQMEASVFEDVYKELDKRMYDKFVLNEEQHDAI